jgi:hypothetical protein
MRCHTYTEITGNLIVHHTHHTTDCNHEMSNQ